MVKWLLWCAGLFLSVIVIGVSISWKHALDPQFLCGDGLWRTNRRDKRKIRKTLVVFYERDRQCRTVSPRNRAQTFNSWILFKFVQQFHCLLIHNMAD